MNLGRDYSSDYFQLYSIKKEFLLDLSELKLKQKMLLQKMHPDLFVNSTAVEKKVASEFATLVNKAFGVLKDPITRGEHLCSVLGLQFDMENIKITTIDLLEKQFEIRNELDEIKKNNSSEKPSLIEKFGEELEIDINQMLVEIDKMFKGLDLKDNASTHLLKEQLANLTFLIKAQYELGEVKRSEA
ncbi:MAG: Fe-S protein assembly co-chaperone HscB [Proteobacteria bacterium]|nr:Fe-S protein assembly co-chaperone HscB [Pseudomonadota bacterium]|tara:strand:+ start:3192 stop:3752 length:561 start_codon:yes stop_codon:yes gene_type:complete